VLNSDEIIDMNDQKQTHSTHKFVSVAELAAELGIDFRAARKWLL